MELLLRARSRDSGAGGIFGVAGIACRGGADCLVEGPLVSPLIDERKGSVLQQKGQALWSFW